MVNNVIRWLACLLICKTVFTVCYTFRDYFPPNFNSDFLIGRAEYFYGTYQWAFYVHVVSGPLSLLFGMLLISESFRKRFPAWHRRIGRAQVFGILLLVTPSGLWMASRAATGAVAGLGFGTLAIATAVCAALGWRRAVQRRFTQHRHWMLRCFVLLCSAVVLRAIGGAAEVMQIEGVYPYSAWASWLVPLAVLELWIISLRRSRRQPRLST